MSKKMRNGWKLMRGALIVTVKERHQQTDEVEEFEFHVTVSEELSNYDFIDYLDDAIHAFANLRGFHRPEVIDVRPAPGYNGDIDRQTLIKIADWLANDCNEDVCKLCANLSRMCPKDIPEDVEPCKFKREGGTAACRDGIIEYFKSHT